MLITLKMFSVTFMLIQLFIVPSFGITGFRNDNPVDLRRQIPFQQEAQVPIDPQQTRFIPLPPTSGFRQNQNEFVQQPSVELNPVQFSPNPQRFVVQQTPQYRPLAQQSSRTLPEPGLFSANNQQYVDNNKPFLPNPALQTGTNYQQGIQENYFQQNPFTNVQQANPISQQPQSIISNQQLPSQPPTIHSFLPTIPTDSSNNAFSQSSQNIATSGPDSQYVNILPTNPLFSNSQSTQFRSILEDQRKQDLERLKELHERQKIIQKHKQFLERQQQKQQQKVQKLHEDFIAKQKKKQDEVYATSRSLVEASSANPLVGREIYPHELSLFEKAIQHENIKPTTISPESASTKKSVNRSRSRQRSRSKSEEDISDAYIQSTKQKNYKQPKASSIEDNEKSDSKLQYIGRQELLKQLKLALVENTNDINVKNFSSREISLPNGEKFEVIKTSDPNLIAGATPLTDDGSSLSQIISQNQLIRKSTKTPKISFEDLAKGVIPPGADFEVIKQTGNGKLEEVGKIPSNLPDQKKVTFVFIEEQNDGSYKVKGVKGNDQSNESPNPDVENVIKKIKDGQIKFPTITNKPEIVSSTRSPFSSTREAAHTRSGSSYSKSTSKKPTNGYQNFEATKISSTTPKYYNSPSPSSLSINHNGSPSPSSSDNYDFSSTYGLTTPSTAAYYKSTHEDKYSEGTPSYDTFSTMVNGHQMHSTRFDSSTASSPKNIDTSLYSQPSDLAAATSSSFTKDDISIISSSNSYYPSTNLVSRSTTSKPTLEEASSQIAFSSSAHPGLIEILKENGLFAAAKYIKQSGLDTILNETGPYTVFAPTDKAFRTLLIQLGGPDKAEEKFKENPRLLSGLLLHHIIPGAFEITTLQDEMTGVSLAGTQLRVNQYDMHDVEWNEIKVTTINGARVLNEKQDIRIPQGIAHAVDRVMFPLPVGDIVQTLQADRERRFNNFLKALFNSGMVEALSDSRTYTVFAPIDKAFSSLSTEELQQLVSDKERSKELVTRHIAPGTLFSAGMRYYQIRDTMAQEKPITLQKNAGRIKVNSGHVITHNIPATNGVIHAVDMLL